MEKEQIKLSNSQKLCVAYLVLVVAYIFAPQILAGITTGFIVSYLFSFPVCYGIVSLAVPVGLIIYKLYKSKTTNGGYVANYISCILLAVASLLLIVFGNGWPIPRATVNGENSLKMVEWNANNSISAEAAREIFVNYDADVVVIPDFTGDIQKENPQETESIAAELEQYDVREIETLEYDEADDYRSQAGLKEIFDSIGVNVSDYEIYTAKPPFYNTLQLTVVIKKSFAQYTSTEDAPAAKYGSLNLKPVDETLPQILAVHASGEDLKEIASKAETYPRAIVVGDFGATGRQGWLSFMSLDYADVLDYLPIWERGTAPTSYAKILRSPSNHIFLPKGKYEVKEAYAKDLAGAEHGAIFAEILQVAE